MNRLLRIGVLTLATCASACGGKLPPIVITIPPPATTMPPPAPPVVVVPPPVVDVPAPPMAPEPEPLPPLVNLNIVVHDAAGAGIAGASCSVSGRAVDNGVETRSANSSGDGFINFAVRGSVIASCSAKGYKPAGSRDLPPGDHRFPLEVVEQPKPVEPTKPVEPPPAGASSCAQLAGPLCVQAVAAKYPELLAINTFASTVEFTQRVLEALGEPWGHVGKTAPESGKAIPPGFTTQVIGGFTIVGVSHDSIKHRITGQVVDIIGNATANEPCPAAVRAEGKCWPPGPANVIWDEVPPHDWREQNPFVPAVPVRR